MFILKKIKNIIISIGTIIRSIYLVGLQALNKRETILYPDKPICLSDRFRGKIVLTKNQDGTERCVACGLCAVVCPVNCIFLQKSEDSNGRWYPKIFQINMARCIFCGFCEEACPTLAIQLTKDFELSSDSRNSLLYKKHDLLVSNTGKYHSYNFYHKSKLLKSNKCNNKCKAKPVDTKSLLP
ncbi:MAG: NADH-quinone oxidoreductase subunit NuoI [Candidatus Lightella neohaematopini]|nr:NADH-quinone oxidoreductase subunit NuoI [Candidatus Lightella neohaematopini]